MYGAAVLVPPPSSVEVSSVQLSETCSTAERSRLVCVEGRSIGK